MSRRDHWRFTVIREIAVLQDGLLSVRRLKWSRAGHVARMRDDSCILTTTTWTSYNQTHKKERQEARWRDEIVFVSEKKWTHS